ncbi:conserved Plasmodium protein, unknown function [Plasmodium relictum]|uniref:Transporter n=1 Tax=Plasmodium relictum TaxID=85471 RepID=A0A1J1H6M5_PLARL|nr:conserved Plasmodium protein, unknown function [Plasmodium relictum]CRH00196.1 conserved Plasmodium protein, unknown function [Plasmodium relictum]
MDVDNSKNSELVERCEVANVKNDVSNSNNKEDLSFVKVNNNEEEKHENKKKLLNESENSNGISGNSSEKKKNMIDVQDIEVQKNNAKEKKMHAGEEKIYMQETKNTVKEGKKKVEEKRECIEKKKKINSQKKIIGCEKWEFEYGNKENFKIENKIKDDNDISKFIDYRKIICDENFLKKKRDIYKFQRGISKEKQFNEIKKKREKENHKKIYMIMENEKYNLNNMNNSFMKKNKKLKVFSSINERNDNFRSKNDLNNIYIDNDFFNNNDILEKNSDSKSILNNSSNVSKKKKFFLILCNGCLVVFLGVSNNICGRMRNRVLKNFDSLTASYNAIAYVTIYLILCIIYSKSKYIKKIHWCYIYPCINNFFKSKNKNNKNEEDSGNNYAIDTKSKNSEKKKKKLLKFYYIHKKKIYEPLLTEDTNVMNFNCNNLSSKNENTLDKEKCNLYNSCSNYSLENNQKVKKFCLNKNRSESFLINNNNKKASLKTCSNYDYINEEISDQEVNSFDEQELKEIIGNYKFYEKKNFSNEIKSVFQKKKIQGIKHNKNNDKYTEHKKFTTIKSRWENMGAYKYVIMIALLDIISNTLYFVSQLAIPLTILLLLNQLNFIFSIILSYLVLKRKYNIHHVISVIIVLVGFLFFYVPFIYKETISTLKQNVVNYYMNLTFYINLNYVYDYNYFNNFHLCNEPVCAAPFGLILSIIFCILSIFLTSFGGILRELFFSEYIKKRQMIKDSIRKECMEIDNSCDISDLGSQKNYYDMNNNKLASIQINGKKQINKKKMEKNKIENSCLGKEKEAIKNMYFSDTDIEVNKKNEYISNNIENIFFINEESQVKYSNKLNTLNSDKKTGILSTDINDTCNYCDDNIFYKFHSSKFTYNSKDKKTENNFPYKENLKANKGYNNTDNKISVILLSFNVSFIQIILLPLIIYFQLLFNKNQNVSYLLYIKDSLKCFSGYVTENNQSCKYAFVVYALYIIINSLFNISVTSFYSNYSSAECFLILKSSTPITLLVLYFFNFPFITDNDKYFSIYFVISIVVVFTGVCYFFYQTILSEKKKMP